MRRLIAASAVLLSLSLVPACSYLWDTSERFEQAQLNLDETTPQHELLAKICWVGVDPEGIELRVAASSPDGDGRVGVSVGSWEARVGEAEPERYDLPRASWDQPATDAQDEGDAGEDELEEACMTGAPIVFTLDDPAAGAATVEWQIEAYAYSSSDEAVEQLKFELDVETTAP